jgi:hypothetical protein
LAEPLLPPADQVEVHEKIVSRKKSGAMGRRGAALAGLPQLSIRNPNLQIGHLPPITDASPIVSATPTPVAADDFTLQLPESAMALSAPKLTPQRTPHKRDSSSDERTRLSADMAQNSGSYGAF